MRGREASLLDEIERGALDSSVPLADVLRKCVALGGRAGSAELRTWASRELNGYGPDDELPEWRRVPAPLQMDFIRGNYHVTGKRISPGELPEFARDVIEEEVPLTRGVGELEALLDGPKDILQLSPPGAAELVRLWNYQNRHVPFQQIDVVYWSLSKATVRGVLDRIRTTLTALVAELRAGMPDDAELPSPELAAQAVEVAVHGRGNRVTVVTTRAEGGSQVVPEPADTGTPWRRWARIGAVVVGGASILGALVAVLAYLGGG